ncbi:acyltransferase domain-containing protein [Blastococcus mobilis]|uniref:[acyl-carrier-protein] S-malonyltransferase n=1 Tax=Blastococcus mobilis TaxID=1938746 RepID=A0A238URS9_9ACTN|nr:acyltransferase domain-containing protein [Blastococcus mobilis]SNR24671.1 Malonyl CoA-acyl carrier protein transacylase [Blastococcus mobilis]
MPGVVLFPGQGSYRPEAARDLARAFPHVAPVYAEVDRGAAAAGAAGVSDVLLADQPPSLDDLLDRAPQTLQLAIYGLSVGVHTMLVESGAVPSVLAGHSLGEIAALAAGGAFSIETGARVVAHRSAVLAAGGFDGGMVALGCDARRAERILALIDDPQAAVACENAPLQTIVSGSAATLEVVAALGRSLGVSVVPLRAPYPFHSPLLAEASSTFTTRLRGLPAGEPTVPVYSPILGRFYEGGDDVLELLASHLTRRVAFAAAVRQLRAAGNSLFVESGAGSILTGLVPQCAERVEAVSALMARGGPGAGLTAAAEALAAGAATSAPRGAADADGAVTAEPTEPVPFRQPVGIPAPRAAEPAPPTVPPPAPAARPGDQPTRPISRQQLFAELQAFYAEALEYPAEVFTDDVELEADLGVDSVKQTELFARTVERYDLPPRREGLRLTDFDTLGKVVDLVWSLLPTRVEVPAPRVAEPAPPTVPPQAPAARAGDQPTRPTSRQQLFAELQAFYAEALEYPAEVFTDDVELEADLGVDSVKQTELFARTVERYDLPPRREGLRLTDFDTLGKVVDLVWSLLVETSPTLIDQRSAA